MKLYLVRHGQTDKNARKETHLYNDPSGLNDFGIKQAEILAHFLQPLKPLKIYSSPEIRAQETAEIIVQGLATSTQKVIPEARLQERFWGNWEGKDWDFISRHLNTLSIHERYEFVPENGESWKQFETRISGLFDEVIAKNEDAALVAHVGTLRAITAKYIFKNHVLHETLPFGNGSVDILNSEEDLQLEFFSLNEYLH